MFVDAFTEFLENVHSGAQLDGRGFLHGNS
jgi:hypothetical protein